MADLYIAYDPSKPVGERLPPEVQAEIVALAPSSVPDGSITTTKLAPDAVTVAKIADDAVGPDQLASNSVTADAIATNAVTSTEIADNAVGPTECGTGVLTVYDDTGTAIEVAVVFISDAAYAALSTPDPDTWYVTTGSMGTYLGSQELGHRYGANPITGLYKGSTQVWAPGGGGATLRDDFNRANTLYTDPDGYGADWDNIIAGNPFHAVISNNTAMFDMDPNFIAQSLLTDLKVFNVGEHADDGYIEFRPMTLGDGDTSHQSIAWRRMSADGANGVGLAVAVSNVGIIRRLAGVHTLMVTAGSFQPGDVLRMTQAGDVHTVTKNGAALGSPWNDSGATAESGAGFRSMGLSVTLSKNSIGFWPGPIWRSPSVDYIEAG